MYWEIQTDDNLSKYAIFTTQATLLIMTDKFLTLNKVQEANAVHMMNVNFSRLIGGLDEEGMIGNYISQLMWAYSENNERMNQRISRLLKQLVITINKNNKVIIDDDEEDDKTIRSNSRDDSNTNK